MADYVIDFYLASEPACSLKTFCQIANHLAVCNDAFNTFGAGLQNLPAVIA